MKTIKLIIAAAGLILASTSFAAEKIYFVNTDHLGTPQSITDAQQLEVWKVGDSAFGDAAPAVELIENNIRFPGQYYDAETGLHYNWNRYYDAGSGRYVTSDPIGLGGGLNTFGYVGGNGLKFSDPLGLVAGVDDLIIIGTGIVVGACIATDCLKPLEEAIEEASQGIRNFVDDINKGDDGQNPGDPDCERKCAEARDDALRSCASLYGNHGLFPGSDSALASCVIEVREEYDDCLARCRNCN